MLTKSELTKSELKPLTKRNGSLLPLLHHACRMVEQPTQVGPYLVPPGVIVFPNLYAIMNYSSNWQQPEQVSRTAE
jgi:hypothetical protein